MSRQETFQPVSSPLLRVPEAFSVGTSPAYITAGLHTALHEFIHVLGGVGPGTSPSAAPFIDDRGAPLPPESVWLVGNDTAYGGKPMTFIVTPRVRAVARAAFCCDSLPGFPLENSALGMGVHWEVSREAAMRRSKAVCEVRGRGVY